MSAMLKGRPLVCVAIALVAVAGSIAAGNARGDDLVTLSGLTYHDVRPLRVEPDGVTWRYDEGICKVDFADSPKSVCSAYHYDAVKAAAFRDAQAQTQKRAEEQTRQVLQENEGRRLARIQTAAAGNLARSTADADVVFRRAASPAASEATRALGVQMEANAAKKAVQPTGVFGAVAHSPAGTVLSILGVSFYQGPSILNQNAVVSNEAEVRAATHHSPAGGFAPDAAHDAFYTPDYEAKSYNQDVDRAAAFATGVPLRP